MKIFGMNSHRWYVEEIPREEIKKIYSYITGDKDIETVYGLTNFEQKRIYLNKELCQDKKRQTLMHELMHAYIDEFVSQEIDFNEETLCNISANAHDIIERIVQDYFVKNISAGGIVTDPNITLLSKEAFEDELTKAIKRIDEAEVSNEG